MHLAGEKEIYDDSRNVFYEDFNHLAQQAD